MFVRVYTLVYVNVYQCTHIHTHIHRDNIDFYIYEKYMLFNVQKNWNKLEVLMDNLVQ